MYFPQIATTCNVSQRCIRGDSEFYSVIVAQEVSLRSALHKDLYVPENHPQIRQPTIQFGISIVFPHMYLTMLLRPLAGVFGDGVTEACASKTPIILRSLAGIHGTRCSFFSSLQLFSFEADHRQPSIQLPSKVVTRIPDIEFFSVNHIHSICLLSFQLAHWAAMDLSSPPLV
jgi:hypothetical protein